MTISLDDIIGAVVEQQAEMQSDPTLLAHLYLDKDMGISQIARHMGLHRSTVYRRLTIAGLYRGPGKSGPPRIDRCKHGHDLSVWGVEKTKEQGGGRYCLACKRRRDRETYYRREARKKAA